MLETKPLVLYLSPQLLYFHHLVTSAVLGFWLMILTVEIVWKTQYELYSIKIDNMTIPFQLEWNTHSIKREMQ